MKITMRRLREEIKKALAGSQPDETYDEELFDDPAFREKSVYVPDFAKERMCAWAKDMKLSTK